MQLSFRRSTSRIPDTCRHFLVLYNSSIIIVISIETDISYKVSDSTCANFFKRSLVTIAGPSVAPKDGVRTRVKDGFAGSMAPPDQ